MQKKTIRNRKELRKRQLKRRVILVGVLFLAIIICGSCAVHRVKQRKMEKAELEKQLQLEKEAEEKRKKQEEIDAINEAAKAAGAEEGILELIAKNEETKEFVVNYPEKCELPPADTIGVELTKGEIPHLLQWDEKWGYQSYGATTIASGGCGPTCMSMIITGLTGDVTVTPYVMAQLALESGYAIAEGGTYAGFMEYAAEQYGMIVKDSLENEAFVAEELGKGHPVVCNLAPGEYFTDVGHFIVITGYKDGVVTVRDPFSIANTEKEWKYEDFKGQIVGLWSYER